MAERGETGERGERGAIPNRKGGESRSAARWLASPAHWQGLGWFDGGQPDGLVLWGEVQGREEQPYRTAVGTRRSASVCGCRSRQRPCKHILALLLLWEEGRSTFPEGAEPMPDWVASGLRWRSARHSRESLPGPTLPGMEAVDTLQEEVGRPDRLESADDGLGLQWLSRGHAWEARVRSGLVVLENWLEDLWQGGVAAFGGDWESECELLASRLTACQAPGLAQRVRQMGTLSVETPDYADQLTGMIGHLALLCLAWRRIDRLRPDERIDLWVATGWPQRRREALATPPLEDHWLHLGASLSMEGRLHRRRTWIYSPRLGRHVLLLAFSPAPFQTRGTGLLPRPGVEEAIAPGQTFAGTVHLFPGTDPVRGLVAEWRADSAWESVLPGASSIAASLAECAAALAVHPWREVFPLSLQQVVPERVGTRWWLIDSAGGHLPLLDRDLVPWRLLALGGGRPIDLFGEWDGRSFCPLTVVETGRWVAVA